MLITDVVIAIIATAAAAAALFMNEDKIGEWAESQRDQNLEWRD